MAECLRRETLGAAASPWAAMDDDSREEVRRRADHLIRLLSDYGVDLVRRGDVEPPSAPTSQTILANQVYAQPDTMREVRTEQGGFSVVAVKGGQSTVEQTFTLTDVMLNAGLVLAGDPAAKTIKDLGRQLAAATEIYRLNAAGAGGGK
ncbi:hypothetical protein EN827_30885 [Mesorhizobium sp. M1D.F.Ca.ET.184.01.1.1]|uniref:hypothetical protein n=2 Tax=Mesorhizobium TaxID=68287 RepID=UPI000FCA30BF|nr:hypothetical protein [Mesorhizobium sp. M1D.F.Ca.ET.231.01.1.1]TGP22322.1 hypothetical protein EN874_019615 [Mesorhizobium sp. M1D.F.Ca.ET.231.01.1.1]TGS37311.1 hypothetical protein EN827_30885 [Mesorhizobium sp. M1D.F.Ca.ET.184.01.1.1]TGS58111.1 hypothetical protein EN826_030860 [Mesorhizobium sp. M1D.F.Ca.ET.183.01.1.1]